MKIEKVTLSQKGSRRKIRRSHSWVIRRILIALGLLALVIWITWFKTH